MYKYYKKKKNIYIYIYIHIYTYANRFTCMEIDLSLFMYF